MNIMTERGSPNEELEVHADGSLRTRSPVLYWVLMVLSMLSNLVGAGAAMLLARYYFVQGGGDRWVSTCVQSAGFPLLLVVALLAEPGRRWRRRRRMGAAQDRNGVALAELAGHAENGGGGKDTEKSSAGKRYSRKRLWQWCAVIGVVLGLDNLLFVWGLSYLPVSTGSLLYATQLPFTAVFSYFLNGSKPTAYSVNSIVVICTSAVLLGLQSSTDKPAGTTSLHYGLGFGATLAGSALYGLILPLMELAYARLGLSDFDYFLYAQVGTNAVATVFALVGMAASGSFRALGREYRSFGAGPGSYVSTLVWGAVGAQFFYIGAYGMIVLSSSLLCCAFAAATLPVVPILAVFFFHDSFTAIKGTAAFLGVWGFVSYIYGGYQAPTPAPSSAAAPQKPAVVRL